MKKKLFLLLICFFVGADLLTAQITKITGTVISDEDGSAVVGASILVKGSSIGTITDLDGNFTLLNIPADAKTLVVSYVGMITQELPVKTVVKIKLKSNLEQLEEVVVVAYGAAKKNSLTGSVATVKSDVLEKIPASSFEKALQGLSAGVQIESQSGQPGSISQVHIRGVGSMSASSQPLYVIDGVAIASQSISSVVDSSVNPLSNLNPSDIETISILKDASAASLYGSRAANGVVMITTKQGSSGEAKIEFKTQFSTSHLPSGGYNLMNTTEHYKTYYQGFYTQKLEKGLSPDEASTTANMAVQEMYKNNPFNIANPFTGEGILSSNAKAMIDTDYIDELFRGATTQQYDLSISGGSDKTKYFISLGYMDQEGLSVGSDLSRYSARINISSKVKSWAEIGVSSTFSVNDQNTPPGSGGGYSPLTNAFYMPNAIPIYALDENFNKTYDKEGNAIYNFNNPVFADMNALALSKKDIYNTKTHRGLVSPFVDLNLFGIHWRNSFSYDYTNMDETNWLNPDYGPGATVSGRLGKYSITDITSTLTSTLNYSFSILDDHHIGLLGGYEAFKNTYSWLQAEATGFSDSNMIELSMASTPTKTKSMKDYERMQSFFGRLNYDYLNKYFLSFSIRTDGSSRFAPGHRWGTFWSLGGNWRISEENFMKDIKWINDLKLRGSYGTSGNKQSNYLYGFQGLYSTGNNYNGKNGIIHSQIPNPSLSWEKSKNFNIGIDFGLFGCLSGSIEYYNKTSNALLLSKPLAISTGFGSVISNSGGMRNQGLEIELHSTNIENKNFTWTTDFNIAFNSNKITSYPQKEEIFGNKIRTAGYSIYEFYIPEWVGVDAANGDPLWYMDIRDDNGDPTGERTTTNTYSKATKYKQGSALPTATGGITNTLSWKGIDFSLLFTYGFGGKIYDSYEATLLNDGNTSHQLIKEQADSWSLNNTNATNPKFIPNNANKSSNSSSRYLHDAGYIKLKNINLGYSLPKPLITKALLQNIRIFISADNLLTWNLDKNFKGYDVELGGMSGVLDGSGTIPLARTFTGGINFTF